MLQTKMIVELFSSSNFFHDSYQRSQKEVLHETHKRIQCRQIQSGSIKKIKLKFVQILNLEPQVCPILT